MRACLLTILAAGVLHAELLKEFKPSAIRSACGAVSVVEFATSLIEVESGSLALHLPAAMRNFTFAEPVWIVGYKTGILDSQGRAPSENHLCHTFLGDQRVMQTGDQEVRGLYSDHYTPETKLPDGFAVRVRANEPLHWMPMFNNRAESPARVRMKVELSVIREKDLTCKPVALFATLRSVETPHLYFVPPGGDKRESLFQLPFDGRIHFMGTHIHPHGLFVELFNVTRGERVWRGDRKKDSAGNMTGMDSFSSAQGYRVKAGETFRLTAGYENPTANPIDAMAGLYILYSRD